MSERKPIVGFSEEYSVKSDFEIYGNEKQFMMLKFVKKTTHAFFWLILFSNQAHAYLDPSTGGLIVQAIIASMVGIGVFFTNLRMKITSLFTKKKQKNVEDE